MDRKSAVKAQQTVGRRTDSTVLTLVMLEGSVTVSKFSRGALGWGSEGSESNYVLW